MIIVLTQSQARNNETRLSFTDPRKVKKRPIKKTFGKAKTSRARTEAVEKDACNKRVSPKYLLNAKRSLNQMVRINDVSFLCGFPNIAQ